MSRNEQTQQTCTSQSQRALSLYSRPDVGDNAINDDFTPMVEGLVVEVVHLVPELCTHL